MKFNISSSISFAQILKQNEATIIVSTYQAGRLIFISSSDGTHVDIQAVRARKPMGVSFDSKRMAVACLNAIEIYSADNSIGNQSPHSFQTFDEFFVPRINYITGHLDLHDIHLHPKGIFGVNTQFNCISAFTIDHNFIPVWKPFFIDKIVPEDRCHLNGMAVIDNVPMYATALGENNTEGSWRENITNGGVLIDIKKNEIIHYNLAMPHSPRIINGYLYFIESATGVINKMHLESKEIIKFSNTGAFSRGLDSINDLIIVGRSKARATSKTFEKLDAEIKNNNAGIDIFSEVSGEKIAGLSFGAIVDEIYDVRVISGGKFGMYGMQGTDVFEPIVTPSLSFWRKLKGDIQPK